MKTLFQVIISFLALKCFSQRIVVVDSLSKKPLSYVAVKFNDNGFYTDESGYFDSFNISNTDSISVFLMGYKKNGLGLRNIKDTIFMRPQTQVLDEIIVSNKSKNLTFFKPLKKANNYSSWVLKPKTELVAVLYPKMNNQNSYIEEVKIVFDKVIERRQDKSSFKNINAVFRINVYDIKNDLPNDLLFTSKPIEVNSYFGGEVALDISDQLIVLTENGVGFSIEMIGFYDENKNINSQGSFIRPALTSKKSSYFEINTYLSYVFNDRKFQSINEVFMKAVPEGKKINRNLIIGLTLSE